MKLIKKYWDEQPLIVILWLAVIFRLLAVIFAKGWGMFDDHFIVIESAGSWTAGHDYNSWLPGSASNTGPTGHNFFYPGFHYLLFSCLNWLGWSDPQIKMYVVRFLHAGLSLITVYCGYRIAETLQGKKAARLAGLLLAVFWFMPWMSVRNLVEMVTVPFLMMGYWLILKKRENNHLFLIWFLAGICFGLSFNIRPQTVFFPLCIALITLFQKKWRETFALSLGAILCAVAIQGGIDYYFWGYPFAEILGYIRVCFTERNDYISLPWYNYFLTIFGLLIPPVSFFLFWGFIRKWKKYFIIFLPVLVFFIFHSSFPNKQERFILPMIPIFIVIGSIGWQEFAEQSKFWKERHRLRSFCWGFFWVINTVLLLTFTFTYSKKARVESMRYLSKYPNFQSITVIDEENDPELMPKFYLNQWPYCASECSLDLSVDSILNVAANPKAPPPRFILFTGEKNIQPMVIKARKFFPGLIYETTVEPGFIDRLVHWLNPINKNRSIFIYRNTQIIPKKIN
ncbi:MAG: glycosyltransferase family 39 protein [Bacteroidales bacterium]|nr:glycosyltransferase family 39 protein [Bacteroidales bacterium]